MESFARRFSLEITTLIILVASAFAISAFVTVSKSVETQSRKHQQSLAPALEVIVEELVKPLHISETLSRSSVLKNLLDSPKIDEQALLLEVKNLQQEYGMQFFVASEVNRKQYNSDGSTMDLEEGKVEWYFRSKQVPQKIIGALGNRTDIHIYFDVKIFSDEGEFLGFIGIGRRLNSFIKSFERFKDEFGYDFIFVDQNKDVVLSSDTSVVADGKRVLQLQDVPWFKNIKAQDLSVERLNNIVVNMDSTQYLITETNLKGLNWRVFIINPLNSRQNETTLVFVKHAVQMLAVMIFAFIILRLFFGYVLEELKDNDKTDPLTGLPTRAQLTSQFLQIRRAKQSLSVILIELENIAQINTEHGREGGDKVLIQMSCVLKTEIREQDVIARWDGAKFVILLPATDEVLALTIAQRMVRKMINHAVLLGDDVVKVTANFGSAYKQEPNLLEDIIVLADDALYKANGNISKTIKVASFSSMQE
ncbi:sensor domain-containing diguanylate cyclase [Aliiglaciecola sp. LCG003]|uniref:sensor domain-containing diguanylate cyclase n=1 Tax=Aliiglaciecola sp. LCG003 TaxID=3053655 RepID=UPI0025730586|nr:sensor domain-containing diguanylate cyclase [Aliiglaciecola sp. LCG003]WJG10947.1 sensor domain-containing diguanylate cyclase [Aliiglaciecola sp. LCG003]